MHEKVSAAPHRRSPTQTLRTEMTIGIDLGDVWSRYCTLNEEGEVVDRVGHITALTYLMTLGNKQRLFNEVVM